MTNTTAWKRKPLSLNVSFREVVCAAWCFLAWFHLPVYTRDGDSIGLYDLALLALIPFWAASSFSKLARINLRSPRTLPVLAYICFLGCVGFSIALNVERVIWPFGFLLYLKQWEYLFGVLITIWLFRNVDEHIVRRCMAWCGILMIAASAAIYFRDHDWNMRLPFTRAGSGAVLGATTFTVILFLLFARREKQKAYWLAVGLLFLGGLFSMGRTQLIAFVLAAGAWLMRMSAKNGSRIWVLVLAGVALAATYVALMVINPFQIKWYDNDPLRFLYAPQLIFSDASFKDRFETVWLESLPAWSSSMGTILFGAGFGSQRYVDGLYFDLLFTTGLVGLAAYTAFHLALFNCLRNYGYLIAFWITTSITNELLLNSYRYMQIVALIVAWLWLHRNKYPEPLRRAVATPPAGVDAQPSTPLVSGAAGNA
jgi:hypothetical protein